jgi:hypothetical protein
MLACSTLVYMQPRDALAATFTPEDMQAMWGLTQMEWRSLQQRRLLNASERRHGATKRTSMSVVQAIGLGMQMSLVHEVGMSYANAQARVREVSEEIEKMWMKQRSSDVKPLTIQITPDSLETEVNVRFGHAWVMLDVDFFITKVGDALEVRDPEYKKWRAAKSK